MESNKRTRLFQEALNEYPAILHVDGDKKIIGYAFFVLLNIAYLSLPFVFCWHGYGYDETMSLIVLLAICYIPNFAIMFYCLWNKHNTFMFVAFGVLFLWIIVGMFIRGVDAYGMAIFIVAIIMFVWVVLVTFIRGKAMEYACRECQIDSRAEAEHYKSALFDNKETVVKVKEPENNVEFLDDAPNWNSKAVLNKPKVFCPKCGFGLVSGENECHVCGTKIETVEVTQVDNAVPDKATVSEWTEGGVL